VVITGQAGIRQRDEPAAVMREEGKVGNISEDTGDEAFMSITGIEVEVHTSAVKNISSEVFKCKDEMSRIQ